MAAELRWILLGLAVPLLAGIWWWTARRGGQAPGNAQLRENLPPLEPRYTEFDEEAMRPHPEPRDWGVPPFEPLSIRTAELDHPPRLDGPMMVLEPEPAAAPPPAPPAAQLQKIVTLRVCAAGEGHWLGTQLIAALELQGLAFGRYQVFHRKHVDGRSLFCVASLMEPGTFDVAAMAQQEFRGVTLFAVLPGPAPPLETLDELLATARGLGDALAGMVQDAKGMPLSPQRAAALREDLALFQASLPRM